MLLPALREELALDFVVINGENAAGGLGITPRTADEMFALGVDAITLGIEFEISEYNRDDQIYTKDMLLAEPIKQVPVADRDLYDTPNPYYKASS